MQRLMTKAAAILQLTRLDADGEPLAWVTAPTVVVTTDTGVTLTSSAVTLTAAVASTTVTTPDRPDLITATWTLTGSTWVTKATVVEGPYLSTTEARLYESTLAAATVDVPTMLRALRGVEEEFEMITDRAMVASYSRVVTRGDGSARLAVAVEPIRAVRYARQYPTADLTGTPVTLTTTQLGSISFDGPTITRTDSDIFRDGYTLVVGVEYGADQVPRDLKRVMARRVRWWLNQPKTGIPDRAQSFTAENGATYQLSTPGAYTTGDPEVDAVYQRYSGRAGDNAIASRSLNYDAQYYSMYHRQGR